MRTEGDKEWEPWIWFWVIIASLYILAEIFITQPGGHP